MDYLPCLAGVLNENLGLGTGWQQVQFQDQEVLFWHECSPISVNAKSDKATLTTVCKVQCLGQAYMGERNDMRGIYIPWLSVRNWSNDKPLCLAELDCLKQVYSKETIKINNSGTVEISREKKGLDGSITNYKIMLTFAKVREFLYNTTPEEKTTIANELCTPINRTSRANLGERLLQLFADYIFPMDQIRNL